jgi:hypothetical protein
VSRKVAGNLMKRRYSFQNAPRCTATSRRTKERCGAPAERGKSVCRFHGSRGGAPKGKANGAYRRGLFTQEAMSARRLVSALLLESRRTLRVCEGSEASRPEATLNEIPNNARR